MSGETDDIHTHFSPLLVANIPFSEFYNCHTNLKICYAHSGGRFNGAINNPQHLLRTNVFKIRHHTTLTKYLRCQTSTLPDDVHSKSPKLAGQTVFTYLSYSQFSTIRLSTEKCTKNVVCTCCSMNERTSRSDETLYKQNSSSLFQFVSFQNVTERTSWCRLCSPLRVFA